MQNQAIQRVVIIGGGTAGWMTAAALSELLPTDNLSITLVESEKIGTVGVGEATLPHLRYFNARLGINEHEFVLKTQASYKLGIEFIDWGQKGESYIHPFGDFARPIAGIDFYHYWLRASKEGAPQSLFEFSLPVLLAKLNKFSYPSKNKQALESDFSYAFHIDANLYAALLKSFAESRGVLRKEGKIAHCEQHASGGNIKQVVLENGERIAGDLFIDCSGFRSLLLGQTLATPFDSWQHWLPCDSAVALPCERHGPLPPYSKARAREAGWQWTIPLRHRSGNGYVYAENFCNDDTALATLLSNTETGLAEPRFLKFLPGRRRSAWVNNCVGIGLSSGFLEPLESTSIYLIQIAIMKLVEFFPTNAKHGKVSERGREAFNRHLRLEYERIRDFLILHYHITRRDDSEFWRYCRNMDIPDSLQARINAFREMAYVPPYVNGLFHTPSWVAVLLGQGEIPKAYHAMVDIHPPALLQSEMERTKNLIAQAAQAFPPHHETLETHCQAFHKGENTETWPPSALSLYGVFS